MCGQVFRRFSDCGIRVGWPVGASPGSVALLSSQPEAGEVRVAILGWNRAMRQQGRSVPACTNVWPPGASRWTEAASRPRQEQVLGGASHGDVEKPSLLIRVTSREGNHPLFDSNHDGCPNGETLGTGHRHKSDCTCCPSGSQVLADWLNLAEEPTEPILSINDGVDVSEEC